MRRDSQTVPNKWLLSLQPKTFFNHITLGCCLLEARFVEPLQDKLSAYMTKREIKLPRLHCTGGNETFFTETSGRLKTRNGGLDSKRNVDFPVIVS